MDILGHNVSYRKDEGRRWCQITNYLGYLYRIEDGSVRVTENGHIIMKYNLGECYELGIGVERMSP